MHLRSPSASRSTAAPRDRAANWFHVTDATVYFDHPVHAMADHTLNIDFTPPSGSSGVGVTPGSRVAIELTAASARDLVAAIQAALDAAPPALTA